MPDRIGLFTGSFDPVTKGHLDLIERASKLFDTLYVGIFYNINKQELFNIEQKERMVRKTVEHLANVRFVTSHDELAVDVAKRLGVTTFVRGLRNGADIDYEANMQFYNNHLAPELETIYLVSKTQYQYLTSSRIRELLAFDQDISAYVPQSVMNELERKNEKTKTI